MSRITLLFRQCPQIRIYWMKLFHLGEIIQGNCSKLGTTGVSYHIPVLMENCYFLLLVRRFLNIPLICPVLSDTWGGPQQGGPDCEVLFITGSPQRIPTKSLWQQWPSVAFQISCLPEWSFGGYKTHSSASKRQQFTNKTLVSPRWGWGTAEPAQGTSVRKFFRPIEMAQEERASTCSHLWAPSSPLPHTGQWF